MKTISIQDRKPIFSWCPEIEQGALDQMIELAKLPFVVHTALMPDAHLGNNMPIGGVVGCKSVVVPTFVGLDIGCGMGAFCTDLTVKNIQGMEAEIHTMITKTIPMGFNHNDQRRKAEMERRFDTKINYAWDKYIPELADKVVELKNFYDQIGTLGGGNHFVELQADEQDRIWIMVHSGSRNIGKKVCDHFNEVAAEADALWCSPIQIPFLPATSVEGKEYIGWMNMCLNFAFYNRQAMLEDIYSKLLNFYPNAEIITKQVVGGNDILNIHHNYASLENHFGQNVWVHRKGATLADENTIGIIPSSMGTPSYIVKGLGNKDSLNSCSHGSGRRMGRKAFNELSNTPEKMKAIEDSMAGIYHTKFGRATSRKGKDLGMMDVSEAPEAYKAIEDVMKNEADLVQPIIKLRPLINWKDAGDE